MDRRSVLALCGKAMVATTGWLHLMRARLAFPGEAQLDNPVKGAEPMNPYDEKLKADMDLLGTRVYSEEGIPMILSCEDLTAEKKSPAPRTAMNVAVAAAFRRCVDAWQRLKPDAPASDVPKLIELLAYRDFAAGGKDESL